jgi:hypothetical protein
MFFAPLFWITLAQVSLVRLTGTVFQPKSHHFPLDEPGPDFD